jgi:Flp pilus assembly protein TadD
MTRWAVVAMLCICLTLGAGAQCLANTATEKEKAFTDKAAQDYMKSGLVLAGEGRDAEAAQMFRRAVATRPGWAEAHSLLGSALARDGKYAEAEAELRKAVELKPNYTEGWYYLGQFYKDRGKEKESQEAFQKAKQPSR